MVEFQANPQAGEVDGREVKLGRTLSSLIERGGYSRNRQEILAALDISPAALSQYARDQTRPSFQKLVTLADFFGVSLDYLVYGEVSEVVSDDSSVAKYVNESVSRAMASARRHTELVGRIGRVLSDRVDAVARELADSAAAGREGLIQDCEAARMESYCVSARILVLDFHHTSIAMPDGKPAARSFLEVVAVNLAKGCDYQFLVPPGSEELVEQFRSLLDERVGRDVVRRNCTFRRTGQPVTAGVALYQLDLPALQADEPALLERVGEYIGARGEFGYLISPNDDSGSDMVMSKTHRERAQSAFNVLWSAARV